MTETHKEQVTLDLDVPDGWEATGAVKPTTPTHLGWQDKDHSIMSARVILRRVLPDELPVMLPR